MKTVTYKDGWGKDVEIVYFEDSNGNWHAEVSQSILERLLERAGVYRAE